MSLEVGVGSNIEIMGFGEKNKEEVSEAEAAAAKTPPGEEEHNFDEPKSGGISRKMSESPLYATDQEEEDDEESHERKIELGPQYTLKEQLEKDKTLEPEVKILSLEIKSPGRPDIVLSVPANGKPKGSWFTLKEGSRYSLQFTFQVQNNIVSGLKYSNTVWKTGVKVDSSKEMIGTFSPQAEPYTHEMPEETTPSGIFARGSYSAKTKFVDDDNKRYLEISYTFEIRHSFLPLLLRSKLAKAFHFDSRFFPILSRSNILLHRFWCASYVDSQLSFKTTILLYMDDLWGNWLNFQKTLSGGTRSLNHAGGNTTAIIWTVIEKE
ncbi:hypothetical protein OIU77_029476 [Salix suchowensis]|uniref:Rho GDP-dissociation inhibitor 1 n=1 Tax=Salix suchowensis TaxID=1278906 RepID=A0ABQ9B8Q4_9ROSI|nr:hypothetical protein OIU77_029476 [Salix suchowensis]